MTERKSRMKRNRGQSLVELSSGIMVLVPLVYCFIDLMSLLIVADFADSNARNITRVAALANDRASGRVSAELAVKESNLRLPIFIKNLSLESFRFDEFNGTISSRVKVKASLPAPLAGWDEVSIFGSSKIPITAKLSRR
ncbi:MAG: hypothetical protein K2X27_16930 [Candidatus Obscuribacterales bacterium]|nr:hypothetical protein [Candidatus Obscuribacterales bacterium]